MKPMFPIHRALASAGLALGLAMVASAAQAQAEVSFKSPEKFTDFGEVERDRDSNAKQLEDHLKKLAASDLAGKQLKIEFTDVDLAGELEPRGGAVNRVRVLRSITIPRMEFHYVLSENGREITSGTAKLKDMNYQMGTNRYFDSEPLRYEKKMLDDWVRKDLLGGPVAASKSKAEKDSPKP